MVLLRIVLLLGLSTCVLCRTRRPTGRTSPTPPSTPQATTIPILIKQKSTTPIDSETSSTTQTFTTPSTPQGAGKTTRQRITTINPLRGRKTEVTVATGAGGPAGPGGPGGPGGQGGPPPTDSGEGVTSRATIRININQAGPKQPSFPGGPVGRDVGAPTPTTRVAAAATNAPAPTVPPTAPPTRRP